MEIGVVGTGYVGLVTGACLASLGHRVTCVDNDVTKVDALRQGRMPIYEPGLTDLVDEGRRSEALQFTTQLAEVLREAEVVFICVGTPPILPSADHGPLTELASGAEVDLSQVETVAREIGACLEPGYRVIVNKSTVPVGSGDWVRMLIEESLASRGTALGVGCRTSGLQAPSSKLQVANLEPAACSLEPSRPGAWGLEHGAAAKQHPTLDAKDPRTWFDVVSNPEFLREGSAIHDMMHPDRIVVGSESTRALALMRALYRPIIEQHRLPLEERHPVSFIETDLASAEMIKYAANAFLATKISFINEIANICERVGANVGQVAHGIGQDARIGRRFLNAGVGWGGSCFGKDVAALVRMSADYGYEARLLQATQVVNHHQRHLVIQKLQDRLKVLKGKTVGLMGLAFKPETDDVRDAPALVIGQRLLQLGVRLRGYDPVAGERAAEALPGLILVPAVEALAEDADALVLVTEWPAFRQIDFARLRERMRHPTLIDARNFLDSDALRALGFDYVGIGQ